MTVTFKGFNTHPGLRQGPDGQRDQARGGLHRARCRRTRCRRRRPTATRATCIRIRSTRRVDRTSVRLLLRDFVDRRARGEGSARRAARARGRSPAEPRASVEIAIEESYRNMREVLDRHPEVDRRARARRSGAPASSRSSGRSAAAPTDRGCRSWACRRRTSSPASTTSTRGWSGRRGQEMEKAVEVIVELSRVWAEEVGDDGASTELQE